MNTSTLAQVRRITRPARLAIAAVLAAAIALPAAATPCYNVTFSFTNSHSTGKSILVKKVQYFDITSNKTRTQDVNNRECGFNKTCTTDAANLGSQFEPVLGHDLTDIQFYFSFKEADGDWSDAAWGGKKIPTDKECRNDRNYGAFSITG